MSFNAVAARSVLAVLENLPPSPSVVELGNQTFGIGDKLLRLVVAEAAAGARAVDVARLESLIGLSEEERRPRTEDFYQALGFRRYVAIDVNSRYGSLIMDLNTDLGETYGFCETFDLVTNNGTGEHVFDQRAVFENVHNLTATGGVMLHVMPFVNWLNHGFYNFNPVLFVDLAAANAYEVLKLSMADKTGFEQVVDLDRTTPSSPRGGVRAVPSARRQAARLVYRNLCRTAAEVRATLRPPGDGAPGGREEPPLGLGDAILHVSPSSAASGTPLAGAVERVMRHESIHTGSEYPVLGNVMVVAALRKGHDRPFRVPMAGRYVHDIETDAVKTAYRPQHGRAEEERSANGKGAPRPVEQA